MRPRLLDVYSCAGGAGRAAIERRFWSHVDKRGPDECWLWTVSTRETGYGQMNIARIPEKAHRVSFLIAFGWLPPAVLHKCDNPPCVNPRHLFGGTQADNMADAIAKGRHTSVGQRMPEGVRSTIVALAECGLSQRAIARQVGVDRRTVGRVLKGVNDAAA